MVRGRVGPPRWGPLRFRVQEGFDGSAGVNLDDFFLFADAFGTQDTRFDLNGDGSVNFPDFFLFADFFGLAVQISP